MGWTGDNRKDKEFMKIKLQHSFLFGTLILFGFVFRLPGQLRETEAADSLQLVEAVNAGSYVTALEILHLFDVPTVAAGRVAVCRALLRNSCCSRASDIA